MSRQIIPRMNLPPQRAPGIGVDIEATGALEAYLRTRGLAAPGERVVTERLSGGVSNKILRVEIAKDGVVRARWVVKQALGKLRVAVDWFSDPRRIHREALGLRWLTQLLPPASTPGLVFEDESENLLAMEAVAPPFRNLKDLFLTGGSTASEEVGAVFRPLGTLLGRLHREGVARRSEVEPVFADRSFFESLRVEPYYAFVAEQEPRAAAFLFSLIEDTRARRDTLVHGDFSPKNILVRDEGLVLLDHEVIHFGDGAFDLGFLLAHLLSKAHHLREARAAFADGARVVFFAYREAVGGVDAVFEDRASRHLLACLLARVRGRSPLEYLDAGEKSAQGEAILTLVAGGSGAPRGLTITGVIDAFLRHLPP